MPLVVVTPAISQDLVALLAVKDELGLTDSAADTILQRIIRRVSDDIRRRCAQGFTRETVTETLPGTNTRRLFLSRTPLVSVSTVLIDADVSADVITDYTIDDPLAGSLYREQGWPVKGRHPQALSRDVRPGDETLSISVTYVGGYLLPSFPGMVSTLPGAIEDVAVAMVKLRWFARSRDSALQSEKIGDYSRTMKTPAPASTAPGAPVDEYAAALAPFMRVHA